MEEPVLYFDNTEEAKYTKRVLVVVFESDVVGDALWTPQLVDALKKVAEHLPDMNIGRYDIGNGNIMTLLSDTFLSEDEPIKPAWQTIADVLKVVPGVLRFDHEDDPGDQRWHL